MDFDRATPCRYRRVVRARSALGADPGGRRPGAGRVARADSNRARTGLQRRLRLYGIAPGTLHQQRGRPYFPGICRQSGRLLRGRAVGERA